MSSVRDYVDFDPSRPLLFRGVESSFVTINKQQVHHLFRPHRQSFAHNIVQECDRVDDSRCCEFITKEFPIEWRSLMWDLATRAPFERNLPMAWLEYFRIRRDTIEKLTDLQTQYNQEGTRTSVKSFLLQLSRYDFECVRCFCEIFEQRSNFRRFTLPMHIFIKQHQALRRKYGIPNGEALPADIGTCLLCMHCKTFKSFVNHKSPTGKISYLYAYGNSKTLIDDHTLALYCGKRNDKIDGKKRAAINHDYSSYITHETLEEAVIERQKKRFAKERRKEIKNATCAETELTSVNLLGTLLQWCGSLYTICPSCGNNMVYSESEFIKDSFYCGCCLSQAGELFSTISCAHCEAVRGNETWSPIVCLTDNSESTTIYLCSSCFKPWIRNASAVLKKSLIMEGLTKRWKKLSHPSNI
jgi:hypothetical protein